MCALNQNFQQFLEKCTELGLITDVYPYFFDMPCFAQSFSRLRLSCDLPRIFSISEATLPLKSMPRNPTKKESKRCSTNELKWVEQTLPKITKFVDVFLLEAQKGTPGFNGNCQHCPNQASKGHCFAKCKKTKTTTIGGSLSLKENAMSSRRKSGRIDEQGTLFAEYPCLHQL